MSALFQHQDPWPTPTPWSHQVAPVSALVISDLPLLSRGCWHPEQWPQQGEKELSLFLEPHLWPDLLRLRCSLAAQTNVHRTPIATAAAAVVATVVKLAVAAETVAAVDAADVAAAAAAVDVAFAVDVDAAVAADVAAVAADAHVADALGPAGATPATAFDAHDDRDTPPPPLFPPQPALHAAKNRPSLAWAPCYSPSSSHLCTCPANGDTPLATPLAAASIHAQNG